MTDDLIGKSGIITKYDKNRITDIYFHNNGIIEGIYTHFPSPLRKIETTYINGKKHGICNVYYYNFDKSETDMKMNINNYNILEKSYFYNDDKKDGIYKEYYTNENDGNVKNEVYYINDKKNGIYKKYDKNGNLEMKCKYIDDKKNGYCKEFYKNKSLYKKYNYIDDKKEGIYKEYDRNGRLITHYNYENDKKNGFYKYYDYGFKKSGYKYIKYSGYYVDDKLEGIYTGYYDNGNLALIRIYKNGNINGYVSCFYHNGQLSNDIYYDNGNVDGVSTSYRYNGDLLEIEYYDNCRRFKSMDFSSYTGGYNYVEKNYKHCKNNGLHFDICNGEIFWEQMYDDGKIKYYICDISDFSDFYENKTAINYKIYDDSENIINDITIIIEDTDHFITNDEMMCLDDLFSS